MTESTTESTTKITYLARLCEKVVTTGIICLVIGFFGVLYRGIDSFDLRLREVQSGLSMQQTQIIEQQRVLVKTQEVLVEQLALLQTSNDEHEDEYSTLVTSLASHAKAIRALIHRAPQKQGLVVPTPVPRSSGSRISGSPELVERQERQQQWNSSLKSKLPTFKK